MRSTTRSVRTSRCESRTFHAWLAPSVAFSLSIAACAAAAAPSAELARCAAIATPDARLSCYDTLAGRSPDRVAAGPTAAPGGGTPSAPSAAAPGMSPATPATTSAMAPAPAPTAAPLPAPAAPYDPQNFGLAQIQVHEADKGPSAIQAHVAQLLDNGVTRASVVLDNGQTWTFTETFDDSRLSPGDPVTIRRAALSSFLLVTPSKHSYHVHRIH